MTLGWNHRVETRERMTANTAKRSKTNGAGDPAGCYFAYGSNLNADDLRDWSERQGVDSGLLRSCRGVARLADSELRFDYYSERRQGGVLNLHPRKGQLVEGVLFELDASERHALERKEWVPTCYERIPVQVFDGTGMTVDAFTYRVPPVRCGGFAKPSVAYLETVRTGLERFGLCTRQLEAAAANSAAPFALDGVFVYGTLMRGEERFRALAQVAEFDCTLLATTRGRLLDLETYPALIRDADGVVDGEFMCFGNLPAVLDVLDLIEGFEGYHTGSLYHRVPALAQIADGRFRSVWTYVLSGLGAGRPAIASGSWRKHCRRHYAFMEALFNARAGAGTGRARAWAPPSPLSDPTIGGLKDIAGGGRPLAEGFIRGAVSEFDLAQRTGNWVCVPAL